MKPCDMLLRSQTRIDLLFTMSEIPHARPKGCKVGSDVFADDGFDGTICRSSIPSGGARRDRTDDLMLAKHALSQLSYGPVVRARRVVGLGRLELPTSRLSSARSNQLSYKPDEASSSGLQPNGAKPRRKKEGKRGRRQGANCLITMFGKA